MKLFRIFLPISAFLFLFSIFLNSVFAQGEPEPLFMLEDVGFTSDNNLTVSVCANNGTMISGFNFWYNSAVLTGPLNASNSGIISATFYNGTSYDDSKYLGFNNNSGPGSDPAYYQGCVRFVLNGTSAYWSTNRIVINATVLNNSIFILTPIGEGNMFTANYVIVQTKDVTGSNTMPNVAIMDFNNITKRYVSNGPALSASDSYWAEHCLGAVVGSNCIGVGGTPNNWCKTHGIGFPTPDPYCVINNTATIFAFDFISSNMSQQNVTPGTLLTINLSVPISPTMIMPMDWNPDNQQGQMNPLTVSETNVSDYFTNEVLLDIIPSGGQDMMPAIIQPNKVYKISFEFNGATYSFPFITPSSGMSSVQILIANSTVFPLSADYKTVIGKVVNETGYAVPGAVVYAQFYKGPSASGVFLFNSSLTNSNGMFSLRIPKTRTPSENGQENMYFPVYQFYIVSNQTNTSGAPLYFPTIDNNGNRGYFATGDTVVLPTLKLKAGGQVDVNVTLNGASLVMSELSKFLNLGSGVIRDAVTGKFTMTSIFEDIDPPTNLIMPLLSPIGNSVIDLFGKDTTMGDPMSGNIISSCINISATVYQGLKTPIICNLTQPGYLNLTVATLQDVFNPSSGQVSGDNNVGSFSFWFETNGILRNSTTGQVVTYLNPEGTFLNNLLGFGTDYPNLTIPLPPGTYTLELSPAFEHPQFLSVYNGTAVSIQAGQTSPLQMVRGMAWNIQPMFNPSMALSDANSINVSVMGQNGALNNSYVNLNGTKILLMNKSEAVTNKVVTFGYDSEKQIFYNTTFNGSSYGLSAGRYIILLNATNVTSGSVYTSTFSMPIFAYDFQVGLDLGGFTFGTNQSISGKLFAFNSSGRIPANTSAIVVQMRDENGNIVTNAIYPSAISNGLGNISLIMPSIPGFYEIIATVNASNKYGIADNYVQASNLNIKLSTNKWEYQPTDNVMLAVQVSNASTGSMLQGASVEAIVDNGNTPVLGVTGSDGKATLTLNSSAQAGSNSWSFGWHSIRIKISKQTQTDVVKIETWFGFNVRGMDLFIRPDRPTYSQTDSVTIDVFGQSGFTILDSMKIDGSTLLRNSTSGTCVVTSGKNFCVSDMDNTHKRISLGAWTVGHHNVAITASSGGNEQTFYSGFDVNLYNVIVSTNKFSYDLNEMINLSVNVMATNGSALPSNVIATLYKAQPPSDINVTQNLTITGISTGKNSTLLNASQPGFNYIKVNASGQLQFIGVQVSSIKVNLYNSTSLSVTEINVNPGSTVTINVNATSGNSPVQDGSIVKATLWTFGNPTELSSNTTTSGLSVLSYQVPATAVGQIYGLEVSVTTPVGDSGYASPAMLRIGGRMGVSADKSFIDQYSPGSAAVFTAILTSPNGTGLSGYNVTFETGSGSTGSETKGTALTDSSGTAMLTTTAPSSDGPYYLHAYLTDNSDVQAYSGFLVSSIRVNVTTSSDVYSPGENIRLTIAIINRTSGNSLNATSGSIVMFNKEKGMIENTIDTSGSQPYNVNVSIPNEPSAVGSYPLGVLMFVNQSQGTGFKVVEVRNSSESLNITLPSTITAGEPFLVAINASTGTSSVLRIFSPASEGVVYDNTSISMSGPAPNASVNITINNPGVYVFNSFVSGIGGATKIMFVDQPATGATQLWTGTSTSENSTSFSTSEDVYIFSNSGNTSVNVLTVVDNATTSASLPLTLTSGSNYYSVLNHTNLISGNTYFIRLDTNTASGVATTMFSVS